MPFDSAFSSSPVRRRLRRLDRLQRWEEAQAFLREAYSTGGLPAAELPARLAAVKREVLRHGFYEHTPPELAYGARAAWRNHSRCIGRLLWESLEVVDCRGIAHADDVAERTCAHMAEAFNGGRIRSMISIFPPAMPAGLPATIESPQVNLYAGYPAEGGRTLGDAQNLEATRMATAMGWAPPRQRSAFDRLPLMIRDAEGHRQLYALPDSAWNEVEIAHPDRPGLATLGLRWYAVPCIGSMILTVGGIDYPCAPFNGFYMCTEIASRDLVDENRYDLLSEIAGALDIPAGPLWKDRAVTELNHAVLSSYERAGVTMTDHHSASDQFLQFQRREQARGRRVSASWMWTVPPQASAQCPVFHLPMKDRKLVPNYYHSRGTDGAGLGVDHASQPEGRLRRRLREWTERGRRWRRRVAW